MIILPAIDLKDGKCVRLYQGDFKKKEVVAQDPIETALKFKESGSEYIHIVDLDGALKGEPKNKNVISEIVKSVDVPIELGGGIRDIETIDLLIEKGVSRIILGTAALSNPALVKEAAYKYKEKIAVGIDAKDGFVAVDGWLNVSKEYYIDFAKRIEDSGVSTIIFTDISRDGTLRGPNLEQLFKLKENVSCDLIASGGIKNLDDLIGLNEMNIYGTIVGKAIYSGNIDLAKAIKVCK